MSVPEVVREIIIRNRSIYDCMKMDLINYTALAVKIQPEIERILGNSVNVNTVVVAIKRYSDSFEIKEEVKEESVLKNARLALTDGIMDIKFSIKDSNEIDPMAILEKFSKVTNNFEFFRVSDSFRFLAEDIEDVRPIYIGIAVFAAIMTSVVILLLKLDWQRILGRFAPWTLDENNPDED